MTRTLRMLGFQLRQFVTVPYFPQLMLTATLAMVVVQALAYAAWDGDAHVLWLRAGAIGMWTVSTVAAGSIGFERARGTLVYLITAPIGALRTIFTVVTSAATFGLAAFPVAWLGWAALMLVTGGPLASLRVGPVFVGQVALLWAACLGMSLIVAALFVLTPNAIAYEELLLAPIMIGSGIVFTTAEPEWLAAVGWVLPMQDAVDALYGRADATTVIRGIVLCALWFALATVLAARALRLAQRQGTIEVV